MQVCYVLAIDEPRLFEPLGSKGLSPLGLSFGYFSWTSKKSNAAGRHDKVEIIAHVTTLSLKKRFFII